ncbi:MAG: hypothetical protein AAGP08_10990 [Pseudomonadota bacterium]
MTFIRPAFCAVGLTFIGLSAAADGVDKMYNYLGEYVDEFEIMGDVYVPDEGEYAHFEMDHINARIYIPKDAAYVSIDANNPIIRDSVAFEGGWVSTASPDEEGYRPCADGPVYDHEYVARDVWGEIEYRYLYLDGAYDLYFQMRRSVCGGPMEDWVWNDPTRELPSEDVAMNTCGNESDLYLRAEGCTNVISNPSASLSNVSWAHWSRGYVLCGEVPVEQTIADFMASMRADPTVKWQEYWQRVSGYAGPMDGQLNYQLYGAMSRWANQGCR